MGLTIKQEKLCHVYMETGNASEAYRQSYSVGRMKPETINRAAKQLIDNPKIATRLQELKDELREVSGIKKERLLYELESILEASVFDFLKFNFDNEVSYWDDDLGSHVLKIIPQIILVDPETLTPQQKRALKSIKVDKEGNFEITLHDKNWVTDRINKMHGYEAPKKLNVDGSALGVVVLEARKDG